MLGEDEPEEAQTPYDVQDVLITNAASRRNGAVGMGGVVSDTTHSGMGHTLATFPSPSDREANKSVHSRVRSNSDSAQIYTTNLCPSGLDNRGRHRSVVA